MKTERQNHSINTIASLAVCAAATALFLGAGPVQAEGNGGNIGVRLVGTAQAYPSTELFEAYGVAGPLSDCWDFDMVDITTGEFIGSVTDCGAITGVAGDGLQVVGTTFFHFPGGTLGTQILTTVAPVTHGSPGFTHITGALPGDGEKNVVYGDGRFASMQGTARLSGAGDFTRLFVDGVITIDCLFVLDLHRAGG